MEAVKEKWNDILQTVKEEHELSQVSFDTWMKPLEICAVEGDRLYILVPTGQMGINYITKKYELPLKVAITEMTGMDYELNFVPPEQAKSLQ